MFLAPRAFSAGAGEDRFSAVTFRRRQAPGQAQTGPGAIGHRAALGQTRNSPDGPGRGKEKGAVPGCRNPSPNPAGMPLVGEIPSSSLLPEPGPALAAEALEEEERYSKFPCAGQAAPKPASRALGEGRSCAERGGNSLHSYGWEGGIQVKHHHQGTATLWLLTIALKLNSGLFFWSGLKST